MNIRRHIPNAITCCNLLSGCIAVVWALQGDFVHAFLFIIIGAVFDFFDGLTARALHVSSPIGKELDSLADDITFGLAPSAMVYALLDQCIAAHAGWFTSCLGIAQVLPYVAYLMAAFSALRLAKFNLDERQTTSFIGLPTPANALFWGGLCVGSGHALTAQAWGLWTVLALVVLFSWLLIAEIPMFSLKFKRGATNTIAIVFLCISAALLIALLVTQGLVGALSAFSAVIGLYVILSLLTPQKP